MNDTRKKPKTAAPAAMALALLMLLDAGACHEGRNALPASPPPGAGGAPETATPAETRTPGVDGPSLGIVLTSKQLHYKLQGGEDRIPARLHDLQASLASPPKPPSGKAGAGTGTTARGKKNGKAAGKAAAEQGPPDAPPVDMTLRIINRSKQRIDFWSAGDPVTITLRLEGAGAVTAPMPVMHTMEMRPPKVVTLGPGETFDLPITRLEFGERGDSTRAYWTRPGDYTIVPSLETAVRPAWPGTVADAEGFGRVMLAGPPLRVHVDAP